MSEVATQTQFNPLTAERTVRLSDFAYTAERGKLYNTAKSAARALDIIDLLVGSQRALRAVDISHALQLSPSSADQVLKTMVDGGYLIFNHCTKEYHLSTRLRRLGAILSETYFGDDGLQLLLDSVHAETGIATILCTAQGQSMQVLEFRQVKPAPAARKSGMRLLDASRFSIFGSCAGAAWLASQSALVVHRTIRSCRRELGPNPAGEQALLHSLTRTREQGYAFGGFKAEDGVSSVAVALPPATNGVVLVLVVAGETEVIEGSKERYAQLMTQAIAQYIG